MRQSETVIDGAPSAQDTSAVQGRCRLLLTETGRVTRIEPKVVQGLNTTPLAINDSQRLVWRHSGVALPLADYLTRLRFRSGKPLVALFHQTGVGSVVVELALTTLNHSPTVRAQIAVCGATCAVEQYLRDEYQLTPAELEVALQLAKGLGLSDVALQRKCSVNTVRSQAAAVLSKLGLRRQAELICIIPHLEQLLTAPS